MLKLKDPKRLRMLLDQSGLLGAWPEVERYPLELLQFSRGEHMTAFEEPLRYLLILTAGRAKVFSAMENGRSLLHTHYSAPGLVGDLELALGSELARTHVQALTALTCIGIPMEACRERLLRDNALLRLCMRHLAQKLDQGAKASARNTLYPLKGRLAEYMLNAHEGGLFKENHTQLAELLGVSYRHLARTLGQLVDVGAIERTPGGLRILDRRQLERLSRE